MYVKGRVAVRTEIHVLQYPGDCGFCNRLNFDDVQTDGGHIRHGCNLHPPEAAGVQKLSVSNLQPLFLTASNEMWRPLVPFLG